MYGLGKAQPLKYPDSADLLDLLANQMMAVFFFIIVFNTVTTAYRLFYRS